MLKLEKDPDWAVRRQLTASLGELPRDVREPALARMLERHGNDPITVDTALSGLRGSEPAVLGVLLNTQTETPQLAAAITMTAATIARGAQDGPVQDVLSLVAQNTRPVWQRSAVLRGAEAALLGTAMPGGGGRGTPGGTGRGAGGVATARRTRRPRRNTSVPKIRCRAAQSGIDARPPAVARAGARRSCRGTIVASSVNARPLCSRGSRGPAKRTPDRRSCL